MSPSPYDAIADLYDSFVQTELDIPFYLDYARMTSGTVLELMSGSGRVTLPLVQAGAHVTAVDNSSDMLTVLHDKLKQAGLSADIRQIDVRELNLGKTFDLIIIPFHALAELPSLEDQQRTLTAIDQHLSGQGLFICALHNPPVRLKAADDQLRLVGKFPLSASGGRLFVWLHQRIQPANSVIEISEFFEEYDSSGRLTSKRLMELKVLFVEKAEFETMARTAGLEIVDLYGDYSRAPFHEQTSPFMIWVMRRKAHSTT